MSHKLWRTWFDFFDQRQNADFVTQFTNPELSQIVTCERGQMAALDFVLLKTARILLVAIFNEPIAYVNAAPCAHRGARF